jgi:hypothetical protein
MKLPNLEEIKRTWVLVEILMKGQTNWRKGMYYRNGGKPCFANYGSEIPLEKIKEWRYMEE